MHEFRADDRPVEPFDFGDAFLFDSIAHEVGAICPDETAVFILRALGARACVRRRPALHSHSGDTLHFVSDHQHGRPRARPSAA